MNKAKNQQQYKIWDDQFRVEKSLVIKEYGHYLGRNTEGCLYFETITPWVVTFFWKDITWIIVLFFAIPLYIYIIPLIITILIIPILIENFKTQLEIYRSTQKEIKENKYYRGLYIGNDFLIFYIDDEFIYIVKRDQIESAIFYERTEDPINDSLYWNYLVLFVRTEEGKYRLFMTDPPDLALEKSSQAYNTLLDTVTKKWGIPYQKTEENKPEKHEGYNDISVNFSFSKINILKTARKH